AFRGIERVPLDEAQAGDIVSVPGMTETTVANPVCDPTVMEALPAQPIDPPTISMSFSINDGPFTGKEGKKVTSRMIRDPLFTQAETNVAMNVKAGQSSETFDVFGRGELHMSVLIETMRREGFALLIGGPRVLFQRDPETGE